MSNSVRRKLINKRKELKRGLNSIKKLSEVVELERKIWIRKIITTQMTHLGEIIMINIPTH